MASTYEVVRGVDGFYRGRSKGCVSKHKLRSLKDHNHAMRQKYFEASESLPTRNEISCPTCGNELYDPSPHIRLASMPPQKHTACSVCNYKGFRIA